MAKFVDNDRMRKAREEWQRQAWLLHKNGSARFTKLTARQLHQPVIERFDVMNKSQNSTPMLLVVAWRL